MKKCVNTCADNDGGQKPGHHWTAFLRRRVKFHWHPEKNLQSISTIHRVARYRNPSRALARRVAELSPVQSPRALLAARQPAVLVPATAALAAFGFRRHRTRRIRKFDRLRP